MPGSTPSRPAADHNLLYGILALQMDFISRDALIRAMNAWVLEKSRGLGDILIEHQALDPEHHALLEGLVQAHLRKHANDAQQSLAAVSSVGSVRQELHQIADPDLQASLVHVSQAWQKGDGPEATVLKSVGSPTSAGLRFRILRPHARGGLGQVYVAHDEELHREVALKEIQDCYADDPDRQARFLLEAEITGGLEHPGIVPVYGLGSYADGRPFYAMRFIRGDSLKDAIKRFHQAEGPGRHPGERILQLRDLLGRFVDVCNAVAYAHSRGILHRDVKPGNIMLGQYGETLVVDWGLAKPLEQPEGSPAAQEGLLKPTSASGSAPTQMGSAIGTPSYMSPEQAAGRLDLLGPASDVYSLGATLYCLLTGKPPFTDPEMGAILQKVQRGDFPRPRHVKAAVPVALEAICLKAMALKPEERYGSPQALADDVEHWLADEPVAAYRERLPERAGRWMRRHRTRVAAALAGLAVAVIALTMATVLLAAANERERTAKNKARDRFQMAREAVDKFYTQVSESPEMKARGVEGLRTKLLETAVEFYEQFAQEEEGNDPKVQAERGNTFYRLGELCSTVSRPEKAEKAYQDALAIQEKLVAGYPAVPEYQSALALSHYRLGILYNDYLQRPAEAEKAHQVALALRKKLVAEYPSVADYQSRLADSYNKLGVVYENTGRYTKAQKAYEDALALRQKLAAEHPSVTDYQSRLAASHYYLGCIYAKTGRPAEAEKAHQDALAIRRKLAVEHPSVADYQFELAYSHHSLGWLYSAKGLNAEAEKAYQDALAIRRKLAVEHPSVTDYQFELANSHHSLGGLYSGKDLNAEAEKAYRDALAIRKTQAAEYPSVPEYQNSLANSLNVLGSLYLYTGRPELAEKNLQDALTIYKKLAVEYLELPNYQSNLVMAYLDLGYAHYLAERLEQSAEMAQEALASCKRLVAAHPKVLAYQHQLSRCYNDLGFTSMDMERYDLAEQACQEALKILKPLFESNPKEPGDQSALAWRYNNLGHVYSKIGRQPAALQAFQESLALIRALTAAHPDLPEDAPLLGSIYIGLADVERDTGRPEAALKQYEKALQTLAPALQKNAQDPDARYYQRDAYAGRAAAFGLLGRQSEALADWDRALDLAVGLTRVRLRASRALTLARFGKHDRAAAEADELASGKLLSGTVFYDLGRIASLGSAAAGQDSKLSAAEQSRLAEQHVGRAIQLLRQARDAGYFQVAARIANLKTDSDLAPLSTRPEFQKLLTELSLSPPTAPQGEGGERINTPTTGTP